jgi:hypothetical protein
VKIAETNESLRKRGLCLEYITLGWNVVGTVIVAVAAIRARSVALAGFGLDSLIEIFASLIVVWQLTDVDDRREGVALRLIGTAFFGLAAYVTAQFAYTIASQTHPDQSRMGILWVSATVVAMLLLA